MLTKKQALDLIENHVENKNIVKHMIALEAVMGGIYDELASRGRASELAGNKDEYMMAGLLHDGDYCESVPAENQGVQITKWAKEKGYEVPENVAHAMASHNWSNTKVEPVSLMDWAIFCADSLTGLIVAGVLVLPSKKLDDLKVESVLKRFKEPAFAKGTRRDEIALCQEKLGIPLEEFVAVALKSMQMVHGELGL